MPRSCPATSVFTYETSAGETLSSSTNSKHVFEALVSRVAGVILEEGPREFLAFVFTQRADDVPGKENPHLHGAVANVGPFRLPPPRQTRYVDMAP